MRRYRLRSRLAAMPRMAIMRRDTEETMLAGLSLWTMPGHARHLRTCTHQRHCEQMQQHR